MSNDDASAHLRAAALELIAAARAMLDLTEELVKDPGPVLSAVTAMAALARQAAGAPAGSTSSPDEQADGPQGQDTSTGGSSKPRVQHIRVS